MRDFDINETEKYLSERKEQVEARLKFFWPPHPEQVDILFDAMEYSLTAGGKRLRPVLHLATLDMLGEESAGYLPFACALEMIHTYSLIHDDLPAMDDDDLRRGRPTCHKAFDEATAILAGDGLLTHAFAVMLSQPHKNPAALVDAVREVAYAAGLSGMVSGQVADMQAETHAVDYEGLRYIHRNKTGALFAASILSAGILVGATDMQMAALTEFADKFGLAFQIADDILDVTATTEQLGKNAGSDIENGKTTYVSLFGLEKAQALCDEASEAAVAALDIFGEKAKMLQSITAYCARRVK